MGVVVLKVKRITIGVIAATLGVAGLVLPVMPGWPFIFFAVFLFSRDVPVVRPLRLWVERRFPVLSVPLRKWENYFGLGDPAKPDVPGK